MINAIVCFALSHVDMTSGAHNFRIRQINLRIRARRFIRTLSKRQYALIYKNNKNWRKKKNSRLEIIEWKISKVSAYEIIRPRLLRRTRIRSRAPLTLTIIYALHVAVTIFTTVSSV